MNSKVIRNLKHSIRRMEDMKQRLKDIPNNHLVIESIEASIESLKERLENAKKSVKISKNQLYINLVDYQGGSFAVGYCGTLKQWREKAMDWSDSDSLKETYNALKNYKIKNCDLIDFINDLWEIGIEEFNPTIEYDLEVVYLD